MSTIPEPRPTAIREVVTIGAFGYDAEGFFRALQDQHVDTFVDIRQRRGVRGAQYAFVNSQRLQAGLAERGIRYVYIKELAPTTAVRDVQRQADAAEKTAKRSRETLSPNFVAAYESEILSRFSAANFLDRLPADAQIIALFCVERDAAACHRSLVARRLQAELNLPVTHIGPPAAPTNDL